ncbi:MAG: amidohydrolase [Bifidobacterium sp.]|jgi:aminobenzoyl-glutamate utilization protein A|nr:amidohydrolase [Bifidobacterium sp.]
MQHTDLIQFRRDLHKNAEPGFCEIRTACRIEERLEALPVAILKGERVQSVENVGNYPDELTRRRWYERAVETGADPAKSAYFLEHGTAIVALLEGDSPGPVWGLRTDIDALPIAEAQDERHLPFREGFSSQTGAMHACGHDCHASIGLGVLEALQDRHFPGVLKVIFQPAEEGVRGAQTILNTDIADDITNMLAIHVRADAGIGQVTASVTGGMATNKFAVHLAGIPSHASGAPQEGRNALLAAAAMALSIMALPRFSTADTRLNIGTLHAGDNVNIVPGHADMTCEARATDDDVLLELVRRVETIIDSTAAAYEVGVQRKITGKACTMRPDGELVDKIIRAAEAAPETRTIVRSAMMGGSDDANLFIRNAQRRGGMGAYINVGANSPAPHHNNYFNPDESCIPLGVHVLENLFRA